MRGLGEPSCAAQRKQVPEPQGTGHAVHTSVWATQCTQQQREDTQSCLVPGWPQSPNWPSGWFSLTSAPKAAGHSQAWSPLPVARGPPPPHRTTLHCLWALLPLQSGGLAPRQENGTASVLAWRPHTPLGRGGNGVNDLHDAVQGRVCANGHVCAAEVIVDGAHQPGDVQVRVGLGRALRDLAWAEASGG